MSEIMQCVFEKREPVRNVTALALMQYACEEFPRSRVDVVGMDDFMDKPSMGDDDILWSVEEREDDVVFTLVDRGSLTPDGVRAFVYKASSGFVRRNMDYQMVEAMLSACVRGTFAKDMRESGGGTGISTGSASGFFCAPLMEGSVCAFIPRRNSCCFLVTYGLITYVRFLRMTARRRRLPSAADWTCSARMLVP